MAITHCPNCHFFLYQFLCICFNILNWLHSCTGGKLLLYVAGKMSIMRYPKGMPFIILKLKGRKKQKWIVTCLIFTPIGTLLLYKVGSVDAGNGSQLS
jgi:hypothetical protein